MKTHAESFASVVFVAAPEVSKSRGYLKLYYFLLDYIFLQTLLVYFVASLR